MSKAPGHWATKDPVIALVAKHPGLMVAGLTLAAFVMKVLFVSRLNPDVALGLVAATAPTDLAVGLLVSVFPEFALLVGFLAALTLLVLREAKRPLFAMVLVAVVLVGVGIALLALGTVLRLIAVIAFVIVFFRWVTRGEDRASPEYMLRHAVIWMVIAGLFWVTSPTMWLPPENYRVAGSIVERTGYFLEDEGEWVTVLEEPSRRLRRILVENLARREPCQFESSRDFFETPVWSLVTGERVLGMKTCRAPGPEMGGL